MNRGSARVRRALGALTAVLAAVLIVLGGAGTAAAHAELDSTDPAPDSVVPRQPSAVTLTFSEGVTLPADSLRVLDPAGERVDTGTPGHASGRPETARVALRDGLADGTYTVAWQVIFADSHPGGGAFTFSVGKPSASSVSVAELQGTRTDGLITFLYGTGRAVAYAAFALLVGAVAFVLVCWPAGAAVRRVQGLLAAGWIGLLGSTIVLMMLRGPYEQGSGITPSTDDVSAQAHVPVDERIYVALAIRLLLLAACGVYLVLLVGQLGQLGQGQARSESLSQGQARSDDDATGRSWSRSRLGAVGLLLAVGLSATWVMTNHASEGAQVWLALPATALHLLAMAAWLGGLVTLAVGLRRGLTAAAVERFSLVAVGSVTVLVLTGLYQSWRGVGSWEALFDTEYGRLLLIKVGCVALMLGAAWFSRSRLARLRSEAETGTSATPGAAGAGTSISRRAAGAGTSVSRRAAGAGTSAPLAAAEAGTPATLPAAEAGTPATLTAAEASSQSGGDSARVGLRRSVLAESALAVAVLVVTTMLTSTPPARTASAAGSAPRGPATSGESAAPGRTLTLTIPFDTGGRTANARGTATVSLVPAATGGRTVELRLTGADGRPADVPEAALAFTLPAENLGPLGVTLRPDGAGRRVGEVRLPLAGRWTVSLTVRSSDIDQTTEKRRVTIGG
ncbi:copper resistance CopC/CopD family protein [Streptomyces stelliscabiei]|uniref:copper resistance CopC/CopD family protein n=1 Tax=Streptomyces stelliscabiei TaxID=146820 RepID=UPI0029B1D26A|nr:copper resistance protein CopC [Streptomyces stelliscabiei]MDX2553459.1 copper resistance protein CopC [Streptomyces stelliscabiei]MDX2612495.1 copper resistance protein CopC [Streptomyces stelliscabiei]MDX2637631.1 copper resistance protein CopC [Streptomyces stelliscabiei]MDX2663693.1 copper resistance protein CopC [Streptomyces stelliscabiei]MDX2717045.1 copper resistance protein CopC [Streptomyces stelliscabiei]